MKYIEDTNFLNGGNLEIVVQQDKKIVIAKYKGYRSDIDKPVEYSAMAICDKEDKFSEKAGIDLVKLKIVKKYYANMLADHREKKKLLLALLKIDDEYIDLATKKLTNIKKQLTDDYELEFPKRKPKKKVTKRKSK